MKYVCSNCQTAQDVAANYGSNDFYRCASCLLFFRLTEPIAGPGGGVYDETVDQPDEIIAVATDADDAAGAIAPSRLEIRLVYLCSNPDCGAEHTVEIEDSVYPGRIRCYCGNRLALRPIAHVEATAKFVEVGSAELAQTVFNPRLREYIPTIVRRAVWQRDKGACVQCGSNERLEYDHLIPVSKGGGNTERNLQLLCELCNRKKRDTI